MSRPWRRPRSATHHEWYSSPYGVTIPRRPVILYVDLHGVPDIMAAMSLPEAYTLTRDNIPNLTEAEEEAFLTYMNHFRYENLNKTISSILDDVYDHINRTWNSHVPDNSLRLSIVNQVGTNQDLRNMETLRFSSAIDPGGLRNKIMNLDHALDTGVPLIRSFCAFRCSAHLKL